MNKRLEKVAELLDEYDLLADIGCDHGYLGIMALNKGIKFVQFIDNKIALESSDDAATVKWGGKWRMPTKAEAKELVRLYRERYGKEPDEEALSEFFWLFTDGCDSLPQSWEAKMKLCGTYDLSKERLKKNNKQYP